MIPSILAFIISASLAKFSERRGVPGLVPMLLVGIFLGELLSIYTDVRFHDTFFGSVLLPGEGICEFLKELALVVILFRAGLGIPLKDLKGLKKSAVCLGVIPMLCEMVSISWLAVYFLGWSWWEGLLLGSVLSAVSPAVVVPRMLKLQDDPKVDIGVPSTILFGASIDDILALMIFGALVSMGISNDRTGVFPLMTDGILNISLGFIMGYLLGRVILSLFSLKVLSSKIAAWFLLVFFIFIGVSVLSFSKSNDYPINPLVLIISLGFSLLRSEHLASVMKEHLKTCWAFAQIPLFVFIGIQLDLGLAPLYLSSGLMILAIGLGARSFGVFCSVAWNPWNNKEKSYAILSFLPKATVQAAIGAVVLDLSLAGNVAFRTEVGNFILSLAVLAILVTAPVGAWLMDRNQHLLKRDPLT